MALYRVLLRSPELEEVVLGGRTRKALHRQGVQVYVEQLLNEEQRARRRALGPVAKGLRKDGVQVRWKGAELEKKVQPAGGGNPSWVRVQLPPPPPSPGRMGGAQAAAEAGAEAGAGAGQR